MFLARTIIVFGLSTVELINFPKFSLAHRPTEPRILTSSSFPGDSLVLVPNTPAAYKYDPRGFDAGDIASSVVHTATLVNFFEFKQIIFE